MLKKLLIILPFFMTFSPAWSMSLEQAVAISIATDPELKSTFNDFMSKHEDINAAKGDYKPEVNFNAGIGYQQTKLTTIQEKYATREASISFSQLIWDASTINNIKRTEFETEAQRFQLLSDAQDKSLKVAESYIAVLLSDQLLTLSKDNVEIHKKIQSDIKRRADSGIGSTADLSQVEARLSRALTNMLAASSNLDDSRTSFYRLVNQELKKPVDPEVDALFLPKTLEDALNSAVKGNPVLKLAFLDIDAAHSQYAQNKGLFSPTFSFDADQSWNNDDSGLNQDVDELTAMINVTFNLYNGGTDEAKLQRSGYQLNKSKDILENTSRLLKESTRLAWSAYQLTEQQKKYLAEQVDSASQTVIAYEKQFRIGRRTLLDLLNTENELFEARSAYLDAYYSNITSKYRVFNSMGTLLDALRVDVPKPWLDSVLKNNLD